MASVSPELYILKICFLFATHLLIQLNLSLGLERPVWVRQNLTIYRCDCPHQAGIIQVSGDDNICCFAWPAKGSFLDRFFESLAIKTHTPE